MQLIAIHGKGGAGKSTVARYLIHRCAANGDAVAPFDADASNGTLTRFYREVVTRLPNDEPTTVSTWFERTVWPAAGEKTVVLDLGSGAERMFLEWATSNGLLAVAKEAGVSVTMVGVLDPSKDALAPAKAAVDQLPGARHVVVRNLGRAKPGEDFSVINDHPVWASIVKAGVHVVDMPMLAVTAPLIDRLNATFTDALAGCPRDGAAQIGPFDRQRVKLWIDAMDASFAPILGAKDAAVA